MKRKLLSGLLMIAYCVINAQNYYPSGSTTIPTWAYNNVVADNNGNYYNNSTGKSGNVIDDAELNFVTFNNGDAYDGAFEFFINTEDSVYTESGVYTGGVDTIGTTISLSEQFIDSLYVSKNYYFSPTEPVVRAIFKIRNPAQSVRTVKVGIYTNMGSDGSTIMDTCSTGGASLTDADRWMVTTDGYPYDSGDPINTWVRFGPGTVLSAPVFGLKPEENIDDYLDTVEVIVPANSYSLILQFNRMDSTSAAARINTAKFNTVAAVKAAGYLTGMSDAELDSVVNWDFSSIVCHPISVNNPQTICEKNSYSINGHTYTIAGNYNDTLQSALGCDSIIVTQLTVNPVDTTDITAAICNGDSYNFHGTNLTTAGTYFHTLVGNISGCDSVISLKLSINTLDLNTSVVNDTIFADQTGATYQWVDCDNNMSEINAETNRWYKATQSGNYAVIVTKSSCSDTTECQNMTIIGINNVPEFTHQVSVYPNPSTGLFDVSAIGVQKIIIFNLNGQIVYQTTTSVVKTTIDFTNHQSGIYLLQITTKEGTTQHLIIKQ
jgi:hypothetical protein